MQLQVLRRMTQSARADSKTGLHPAPGPAFRSLANRSSASDFETKTIESEALGFAHTGC